jgi:hypothetical protein
LPICRSHLIYKPFEFSFRTAMRHLGTKEIDMATLVSTLLGIERLGPVHVGA